MPNVSGFVSQLHVPPRRYSFRTFQDLPVLVREGLAWGTKMQDRGNQIETHTVAGWIIDHYDVNQTLKIGELIQMLEEFVSDGVHCRMVRCFVDAKCNMLAAKLAWHEDY